MDNQRIVMIMANDFLLNFKSIGIYILNSNSISYCTAEKYGMR
jgi:hypothetical protein